jgi:membrane-bound serine protease (ClpP class)
MEVMELIVFLLVAGAMLMLLEPFFPTLIAGLIGLACWASAVAVVYSRYGTTAGHITVAVVLAVGLAGTWFYFTRLPASRIAKPFRSASVIPTDNAGKTHLLNQSGVAVTPLRPGGMAEIAGERVDVVTSGEPLERGSAVTVVAVEGACIRVRAA